MSEGEALGVGINEPFWEKMGTSEFFTQSSLDTPDRNAARDSLRVEFLPMVYFLEQHGELPSDATPDSILAAALNSQTLALDEAQRISLKPFLSVPDTSSQKRDWIAESTQISLQGPEHPIRQLRNRVTERLLPTARLKLSMS